MNRFIKCVAAMMLILSASTVSATEFKQTIGSGIQFGGVLGWQGSLINSNGGAFKLSVGYTGTALGYERFLSPSLSLNGHVFANQYISGAALSANYYLSTGTKSGWVIGLDAYRGYNTGEQALDSIIRFFEFAFDTDVADFDPKLKYGAFVSVGYRF